VARRESPAPRSSSTGRSSRAAGRSGPRGRDGKVEVSCPQCAAQYRVDEDMLDGQIECSECHRVFSAKANAGKRARGQDNTKTYVIFGIVGVFVVGTFIAMSGGSPPAPQPKVTAPPKEVVTRSTHPRTAAVLKWGQAMGTENRLVIQTHSDPAGLRKVLELAPGAADDEVFAAIKTHDATRFLRELEATSAMLTSDEAMTAATGKAVLYVTPKADNDDWRKNTRGEFEVEFQATGDQIKVTNWTLTLRPARNPAKPEPKKGTFEAYKDIAAPTEKTITDEAGTRAVQESEPSAIPHWEKATPEMRAKADKIVADIVRSADQDAPATLFNRAYMPVVGDMDLTKAVVPRLLNAMFENYGDVNANNLKLSQLNRALGNITGYAVNYSVIGSGDPAVDKKRRESCVRQWFAFWWRYSGDLSKFFDERENLEEPLPEKTDPKKKPAK
jgi:predicted Zn finger-like uncharacterized protein